MTTLIVNIDVDDLARAKAFYLAAFELRVGRTFGAAAIGVELVGAGTLIYLLTKASGTTPAAGAGAATRDYRRHWTPVHLDFIVDDIAAAVARVVTAGATRESEIEDHKYGKFAQFADPFGHGFCLIELVGRGYDEIADPR